MIARAAARSPRSMASIRARCWTVGVAHRLGHRLHVLDHLGHARLRVGHRGGQRRCARQIGDREVEARVERAVRPVVARGELGRELAQPRDAFRIGPLGRQLRRRRLDRPAIVERVEQRRPERSRREPRPRLGRATRGRRRTSRRSGRAASRRSRPAAAPAPPRAPWRGRRRGARQLAFRRQPVTGGTSPSRMACASRSTVSSNTLASGSAAAGAS